MYSAVTEARSSPKTASAGAGIAITPSDPSKPADCTNSVHSLTQHVEDTSRKRPTFLACALNGEGSSQPTAPIEKMAKLLPADEPGGCEGDTPHHVVCPPAISPAQCPKGPRKKRRRKTPPSPTPPPSTTASDQLSLWNRPSQYCQEPLLTAHGPAIIKDDLGTIIVPPASASDRVGRTDQESHDDADGTKCQHFADASSGSSGEAVGSCPSGSLFGASMSFSGSYTSSTSRSMSSYGQSRSHSQASSDNTKRSKHSRSRSRSRSQDRSQQRKSQSPESRELCAAEGQRAPYLNNGGLVAPDRSPSPPAGSLHGAAPPSMRATRSMSPAPSSPQRTGRPLSASGSPQLLIMQTVVPLHPGRRAPRPFHTVGSDRSISDCLQQQGRPFGPISGEPRQGHHQPTISQHLCPQVSQHESQQWGPRREYSGRLSGHDNSCYQPLNHKGHYEPCQQPRLSISTPRSQHHSPEPRSVHEFPRPLCGRDTSMEPPYDDYGSSHPCRLVMRPDMSPRRRICQQRGSHQPEPPPPPADPWQGGPKAPNDRYRQPSDSPPRRVCQRSEATFDTPGGRDRIPGPSYRRPSLYPPPRLFDDHDRYWDEGGQPPMQRPRYSRGDSADHLYARDRGGDVLVREARPSISKLHGGPQGPGPQGVNGDPLTLAPGTGGCGMDGRRDEARSRKGGGSPTFDPREKTGWRRERVAGQAPAGRWRTDGP